MAATAPLVEESRKITFGGCLIVSVPHQVRSILNQRAGRWLTDSRILKYEAILLEKDDLILSQDHNLNPASFLSASPEEPVNLEHCCLDITDYQTKVREDLQESPLFEGVNWFIDGSSRVIEGKRQNGYAIIDGDRSSLVQASSLPKTWSAQTCELYALHQALKLLEGKEGSIYTDSKYVWGVAHVFGKIWEERGMVNSKGKELAHTTLLTKVLSSLLLPKAIAIVHVKGHPIGNTFEARGNRLADEEARKAGEKEPGQTAMLVLIPTLPPNLPSPSYTQEEKKKAQDGSQGDRRRALVSPGWP